MRKLLVICLTAFLAAGCAKEKIVTKACAFDVRIDWVKGSKVQFTVTPDNPDATYAYGVMAVDPVYADWTDKQFIDWQLDWMKETYDELVAEGAGVSTFSDMFCYKGARTIRETRLSSGMDWWLLLFQVNPETREAIGPLYKLPYSTPPVPLKDMTFTIRVEGNRFTIVPDDPERTWFWEYETEAKIDDVYDSAYGFYYDIINMYDQYDFLDHLLCKGTEEWELPRDDRSIKEGVRYYMALSGCADGEITSDVLYASFYYRNGRVEFEYSDVEIIDLLIFDN